MHASFCGLWQIVFVIHSRKCERGNPTVQVPAPHPRCLDQIHHTYHQRSHPLPWHLRRSFVPSCRSQPLFTRGTLLKPPVPPPSQLPSCITWRQVSATQVLTFYGCIMYQELSLRGNTWKFHMRVTRMYGGVGSGGDAGDEHFADDRSAGGRGGASWSFLENQHVRNRNDPPGCAFSII